MTDPRTAFTTEQIERSRRYHRPLYAALLADIALALGVLAAFAWSPLGDALYDPLEGFGWPAAAAAFGALALASSTLVRLPISLWRGYLHEREWGFSTQTLRGWLADRGKSFAVAATISVGGLLGLVASAQLWPSAWPAVAAPAAALLVLALSFVGPLVLEPIFNRFDPLPDRDLADELRALSVEAGVPVREVLVADASRRTRKVNAYVSGLGDTRRVVVFDTLLERAPRPQLRLVVAHELAHRRERHVAKGTLLGMAGAAAAVLVLWAAVRDPGDPRSAPLLMLVFGLLELASLPIGAALSRRWERVADRISLDLTGDRAAYVDAHRELALSNLSDLDPPRALYLLTFTHPTPPERIAAVAGTG